LRRVPRVLVDDENKASVRLYGCSYGENLPAKTKKKHDRDIDILVIHKEIGEHQHIKTLSPREFLKDNDYDLILAGDIHKSFHYTVGDRNIINVGPLFRREATQEMIDHVPHFAVYNTRYQEIHLFGLKHEKPSKVLSRDHLVSKEKYESLLQDFINEISEDENISVSNIVDVISEIISKKVEKSLQNKVKETISFYMNKVD
jgi:hypothetical protein